jgi:hypothetical protein
MMLLQRWTRRQWLGMITALAASGCGDCKVLRDAPPEFLCYPMGQARVAGEPFEMGVAPSGWTGLAQGEPTCAVVVDGGLISFQVDATACVPTKDSRGPFVSNVRCTVPALPAGEYAFQMVRASHWFTIDDAGLGYSNRQNTNNLPPCD